MVFFVFKLLRFMAQLVPESGSLASVLENFGAYLTHVAFVLFCCLEVFVMAGLYPGVFPSVLRCPLGEVTWGWGSFLETRLVV